MLGERLKQARLAMGMSIRAFAKFLGINFSTLSNYERSLMSPGSQALESYVRCGFCANWLLTGEGSMWRPRAGGPDIVDSTGTNEWLALFERLGLRDLAASAIHGSQSRLRYLIDYVGRKRGSTAKEIVAGLKAEGVPVSLTTVTSDFAYLLHLQLVVSKKNGARNEYELKAGAVIEALDEADQSQRTVAALTYLAREIAPSASSRNPSGMLRVARIISDRGRGRQIALALKAIMLEEINKPEPEDGGETITMVIGICSSDSKEKETCHGY